MLEVFFIHAEQVCLKLLHHGEGWRVIGTEVIWERRRKSFLACANLWAVHFVCWYEKGCDCKADGSMAEGRARFISTWNPSSCFQGSITRAIWESRGSGSIMLQPHEPCRFQYIDQPTISIEHF